MLAPRLPSVQINRFTCTCPSGTTGQTCNTPILECRSSPCQHQSTCWDEVNGYRCECGAGFTGVHCETDIDECQVTPQACLNGGRCVDHVGRYSCTCSGTKYTGTRCEQSLCLQHCITANTTTEVCEYSTTAASGVRCLCKPGITGLTCGVDIDECQTLQPCQNGATCSDHLNDFTCSCVSGYTGKR